MLAPQLLTMRGGLSAAVVTLPFMSVPPHQPHDRMFRHLMRQPVHAASELRAVLPAELVARLDLDQLAQVPGAHTNEHLRAGQSDLLFTVPCDGRDAYVYVLIEHQSSPDRWMAWRMLRYIVEIWDNHLRQQRRRGSKADRLPMVIPLVVHHSRRPWTVQVELADLIDPVPGAAPWMPRFRFLLDDLAAVDVDSLRARPLTAEARVLLVVLKLTRGNPHLAADLGSSIGDLTVVLERDPGLFQALVSYIAGVGEAPDQDLAELFAEVGSEAEEVYMTTAQMLQTKGRAEGRTEGRAEGRAETLVQQLRLRFGTAVTQAHLDRVAMATMDQLTTWTARVLTADTIDDTLTDDTQSARS